MSKQIEEMAKDIYESKSCDTSFEENCKLLAYDLVTLGYQKVDTNSVILTKGAYESLSSKAKQNVVNAVEICKETIEKDFNSIIQALEDRKDRVKTSYGVNESVGVDIAIRTVKELAKQFNVEIKE